MLPVGVGCRRYLRQGVEQSRADLAHAVGRDTVRRQPGDELGDRRIEPGVLRREAGGDDLPMHIARGERRRGLGEVLRLTGLLGQRDEVAGHPDEITWQTSGHDVGQCHELFRHADHAAAQQPAGLREVQTGYVHDRVEGGVERVAQRQAAPLEGAHRVLRDGDQVVAAGDAEDALDVVQEGVDVGAGVELVQLVDADVDAPRRGRLPEELAEPADDLREAHGLFRHRGAGRGTHLDSGRQLHPGAPAVPDRLLVRQSGQQGARRGAQSVAIVGEPQITAEPQRLAPRGRQDEGGTGGHEQVHP